MPWVRNDTLTPLRPSMLREEARTWNTRMTMPSSEITITELSSRVNSILPIGWHVELQIL
ncbi:hypothetical protein PILCRDRAFT_810346, partial [Piloderma croceum F 1598]